MGIGHRPSPFTDINGDETMTELLFVLLLLSIVLSLREEDLTWQKVREITMKS